MTDQPLFRPESLAARRDDWLGETRVATGLPSSAVVIAAALFLAAAALFVTQGEYTRRVKVSGVVQPQDGLTRIAAPQAGWITSLKAREGDRVKQGDTLYVLGVDSTSAVGETQGAITEVLTRTRQELTEELARQAAISVAEKRTLRERAASFERELAQIDTLIGLHAGFTDEMQGFVQRQQQFLSQGIAASRDYEARLQAFNAQKAQLENLRRERIQVAGRLAETKVELDAFDDRAAEKAGALRRQILGIDQEIAQSEARRELRILAPRAGRVTGVISLEGQTVATGTPLLTIVPDNEPLVVQLLAPTAAIGFVEEGSRVLLRYAAYPYQRFGQYPGRVAFISRATLGAEETAQLNVAGVDPAAALYRITVTPEKQAVEAFGRQAALQAGMQVEAHILAETRPLYEWILAPVYGLGGALSGRDGEA